MPKFLIINDEKSRLQKVEVIEQVHWNKLRDDIINRFKHGIAHQETIEILDIHYNFLGSILYYAMETGLKRAKVKWFLPHYDRDGSILEVETTNEKIAKIYNDKILSFGIDVSHQDRLHFYLRTKIPNFIFEMLYEAPNVFWKDISKLFSITTSRFWVNVPHEDVDQKILDNGNYGFYKFIKYLIATEIKPFSSHISRLDTNGTIELTFFAWSDLGELVKDLSTAVEIIHKIFSHLLRRFYLKEKKLKTKD